MIRARGSGRPARGPFTLVSRRAAALAVLALALAFAATLLLFPWSDESVGDLGVRTAYAERVLGGELPYRDFPFEYPPLAAPAIALPGIVGTEEDAYRGGITAFTFLLTAGAVLLAGALAARTGGSARVAMAAAALAPLLLGAVVRLHFDPLAVVLTLAALLALVVRRPALGLALVGLGTMTKGFPIVVAPVALAWLWQGGDRRDAIRAAGALAVTLGVIGAGWLALSPEGALDSLEYQLDRPVQLESSPGSVLFLVGALGGEQPAVVASHGAAGLVHPLDGPIGLAFTALLVAAVAALAVGAAVATRRLTVAARARGRGAADRSGRSRTARATDPATDRALVLGALAAVTAFAAFGRVLSPQYLVWAVPLLALSVAWGMRTLAALAAAACALTLAEFPSRYLDLVAGEPLAVGITVARNAALLAAVVVAGAALWRLGRSPREEAARGHALTSGGGAPARSIEPAHPVQPR